jgi:transposase
MNIMAAHRIPVPKILAIFRFLQQGDINYRKLAKGLSITRNTLKKYVASIRSFQVEHSDKNGGIDFYLKQIQREHCLRNTDHFLDDQFISVAHAIIEGDTRKAEWLKYHAANPDGYKYSRFCSLFSEWCKANYQSIPVRSKHLIQNADQDRDVFLRWKRSNNRRKWTQALAFLELEKGATLNSISRKLGTSRRQIKKWLTLYKQGGMDNLEKKPRKISEANRENIQTKKENLIKLMHQTPQLYGINRTAWGIKSLAEAYCKVYGCPIGKSTVSAYIRREGFAFRKAKRVLTSPDPLYREKMSRLTSILTNLGQDEKFFSVDEFGPFSVKRQGGRSQVKKGERRTYPQWQRSKGKLICTAALELSTNQVTHFSSEKKNSGEMIKLIEVLIKHYQGQKRIFFSWDAASWHASKKVTEKIKELNPRAYRKQHNTPLVELAPLPASAQFLNVIESVFSGMAKAIIHNSNYSSIKQCQLAINSYFAERNTYFQNNPQRAGKKIWGKELSCPVFNEAGIFKDSRWR